MKLRFVSDLHRIADCLESIDRADAAKLRQIADVHTEMYDALDRALAAVWDSHYGKGIEVGYAREIHRIVEAVLAKARGETS